MVRAKKEDPVVLLQSPMEINTSHHRAIQHHDGCSQYDKTTCVGHAGCKLDSTGFLCVLKECSDFNTAACIVAPAMSKCQLNPTRTLCVPKDSSSSSSPSAIRCSDYDKAK